MAHLSMIDAALVGDLMGWGLADLELMQGHPRGAVRHHRAGRPLAKAVGADAPAGICGKQPDSAWHGHGRA